MIFFSCTLHRHQNITWISNDFLNVRSVTRELHVPRQIRSTWIYAHLCCLSSSSSMSTVYTSCLHIQARQGSPESTDKKEQKSLLKIIIKATALFVYIFVTSASLPWRRVCHVTPSCFLCTCYISGLVDLFACMFLICQTGLRFSV